MKKKCINFKVLITLIISIVSTPVLSVDKFDQISWLGKFLGKTIVIENPYGSVRLRYGGENNALEYIAVAQNLDTHSNLIIKTDREESSRINFSVVNENISNNDQETLSRLDVTFFIPKNKDITIITNKDLIEAKGLIANIKAVSVSGSISLNKNTGSVNTINESGKTDVTITQLSVKPTQEFISTTGEINVWVNRKSNYLVEVSTSSDIITDFSMKIKNSYNQEPNKKGIIKLNKKKSKIIITSKRGRTAIRGFGKNN